MTILRDLTLVEILALDRPLTSDERRVLVEAPLGTTRVYGRMLSSGGISVGEPVLGRYGRRVGIKAVALRGSADH